MRSARALLKTLLLQLRQAAPHHNHSTAATRPPLAPDPHRYAICLAQVQDLINSETPLARAIIRQRFADQPVTDAQYQMLRALHREGVALRAWCADPTVADELARFQGLTVHAVMVDPSLSSAETLQRELARRYRELDTLLMRRRATMSGASADSD